MLTSAGARSLCMGQEGENGTLKKDDSSEMLSGCI